MNGPKGSILQEAKIRLAAANCGRLAAVGELATELRMTDWKPGEATDAALTAFNKYVEEAQRKATPKTPEVMERVRRIIAGPPVKKGDAVG
jgi:hypothetical protein